MSALEFEVYEIFKNRFTDKEAAKVIDVFMTKDDKVEMISRIESSKTDTIKWMFIFWIG